MKLREFDDLTLLHLGKLLVNEQGFSFANGTFCKRLADGTRQLVSVDFDVRSKKTFRVIVGFNHDSIAGDTPPSEAGMFGARYVNERGFAPKPINFSCLKPDVAAASLINVRESIARFVLPWFQQHADVAKVIEVVEAHYPFVKGKLLVSSGNFEEARKYFADHLEALRSRPPSEATANGIAETCAILEKIDA